MKNGGPGISRRPSAIDCDGLAALVWDFEDDYQLPDSHSDGGCPSSPPDFQRHRRSFLASASRTRWGLSVLFHRTDCSATAEDCGLRAFHLQSVAFGCITIDNYLYVQSLPYSILNRSRPLQSWNLPTKIARQSAVIDPHNDRHLILSEAFFLHDLAQLLGEGGRGGTERVEDCGLRPFAGQSIWIDERCHREWRFWVHSRVCNPANGGLR